jgi:DNA-binding CsgD family transcriptional regulator
MRPKKLVDETVTQIVDLLTEGVSVAEIAQRFDVASDTVLWIALGHSYKHVDRGAYVYVRVDGRTGAANKFAKLDDARVVELLRMLTAGATCQLVAETFGVSVQTVYSIRDNRTWKHVPRTAM